MKFGVWAAEHNKKGAAMPDPITTLHYTPGANIVNGAYAPGVDGFNLADVSSKGNADILPTGVRALVWMGDTIAGATASFKATINSMVGDSKVYGFYIADEPGAGDAANLKAEADYIHATIPGAKVFMVEQNLNSPDAPQFIYNPANTDIDLFGLDPYPVRSDLPGGFEPSIITTEVNAAEVQGIPQADIVPVYQAFGNESPWVMPTPAQEQTILSTWGSVIPTPVFDYAYSWGVQNGDQALSVDPALQAVLAAHNAERTTTPTVLVSISSSDVNLAHTTATVTFTFSEAPTTFSLSDTSAVGGTLSAITKVNATQYTATFAAAAGTDISKGAVSVTAGTWQNNGNPGAGGSTGSFIVDTVTPTVSSVTTSGTGITNGAGDLHAGAIVTLAVTMSEVVTVTGGMPTLSLNDGGTATYAGISGNSLLFKHTVQGGQNTSDLTVSGINLNGAKIADATSGNGATLAGAVRNPPGTLKIDTTDDWKTATSANWTTASDWTNGVPNSSYDAFVKSSGTYMVTISSSDAAHSLTVNDASATVTDNSGGALTLTAGLSVSAGTFQLGSGSLQAASITLGSSGHLIVSQGNYTGAKAISVPLTNNGSVTFENASAVDIKGAISGSGSLTVQNSADLKIDGADTGTGSFTISNGATLELNAADKENVKFSAGSTGTLKLDRSSTFTGSVAGLSTVNKLDLSDLAWSQGKMTASFSGNTSGGVLSISDGTKTDKIALTGNYTNASWKLSSDGSGGTFVVDPPAGSSDGVATSSLILLAQHAAAADSLGGADHDVGQMLGSLSRLAQRSPDTSRLVVFGDSLSDNGNLFNLIGEPTSPYWKGRFSNGPVYAEQLANWLGVPLKDYAFGGATASDASPGILLNPATGQPLPINLPEQIAGYLAQLHGHQAPDDSAAVIYIGNNDYINYLQSDLPKDPQTVNNLVADVVANIGNAINDLTQAGVEKIALFTLPDLAVTPAFQADPSVAAFAQELDVLNNAALEQLASSHPNVRVVDIFKLSEAVAADPLSFGFTDLTVPMVNLLAAGSSEFAPNEVGFFDSIHPTYAGHSIQAAFADAMMSSDVVQFLDGTQSVVHAHSGSSFIFATPIDPTNPSLNDNYTIYGGSGSDLIFAGSGNVTVHGGSGNDLIAAGSGDAKLYGGGGSDVLATNSMGTNLLDGGRGSDALIANRGGTNTLEGGSGNDLIVLKENASLVNPTGTFDFGTQTIDGGQGRDTLRIIINDQIPSAENALVTEFHNIEAAFDSSIANHQPGTFQADGLNVTGIDQLQLQVDSVSTDPNTPYLITHNIVLSDGRGAPVSNTLNSLLQAADHWGLLTV
jgi:phospholipase/lecithinase/hemolysin